MHTQAAVYFNGALLTALQMRLAACATMHGTDYRQQMHR